MKKVKYFRKLFKYKYNYFSFLKVKYKYLEFFLILSNTNVFDPPCLIGFEDITKHPKKIVFQEEKKILYFYPPATDVDEKIKQVGFCEAIIQFTS